jgi:hypothetical protein
MAPEKNKKPRNKAVSPSEEQKIRIVEEMIKFRAVLFFETSGQQVYMCIGCNLM